MEHSALLYDGLALLDTLVYLKWGALAVVTMLFFYALRKQNRQYRETAYGYPAASAMADMARAVMVRGYVVAWLWVMLMLLIIYRDIENTAYHAYTQSTVPSVTYEQPTIASPVATQQDMTVTPAYQDNTIDSIKASYEDALVSYMILKRCKVAGQKDYEMLYSALTRSLERYDRTGTMTHNVITAATGTYHSLYHDVPCNQEYLVNVQRSLKEFLKGIETP